MQMLGIVIDIGLAFCQVAVHLQLCQIAHQKQYILITTMIPIICTMGFRSRLAYPFMTDTGRGGGGHFGVIVVRVCEPVF